MDKELIAMCDCPEIQDKWEPKCGDIVMYLDDVESGAPSAIYQFPDGYGKHVVEHPEFKTLSWDKENFIFIPRIEDVLEWLEGRTSKIVHHWDGWRIHIRETENTTRYGPAILVALIKAYMHLDHNKTWNGEAWV